MRHIISSILIVFFIFLFGCSKGNIGISDKVYDLSLVYQKLLELHNKERSLKGLNLFIPNDNLTFYAQNHAEIMANHNSLYHSDISDLLKKFNLVGENIAFGQEDEKDVLNSWMHSTGHRENILNEQFKQIGFGVSPKNNRLYWVTVFSN
jgi:uncharacterized protein YkwD